MSMMFYVLAGAWFFFGLYATHVMKNSERGIELMKLAALFSIAGALA